jgi:hypothetical protein
MLALWMKLLAKEVASKPQRDKLGRRGDAGNHPS